MLLFDPVRVMMALDEVDPEITDYKSSVPAQMRHELVARLDRLAFFFKLLTFKEAEPWNPWRMRGIEIERALRAELGKLNSKYPEIKEESRKKFANQQRA